MKRRAFIAGLGSAAVWPTAAEAQKQKGVSRLCFLTGDTGTAQSPSPRFEAFFRGLQELGYVNGQNLSIDYITSNGHTELFPELAAECVRLKPDVIAVTTTPGAHALKQLTPTIPIVMVALGDPVGTGLVDTLAKPGGNITGMSQMTSGLAAKRLELLKEAVPMISRVLVIAYLVDPISPLQVQAMKDAAPSLGMTLQIRDIRTVNDLPSAFETGVSDGAQGTHHHRRNLFPRRTRASDRTRELL